MEVPATTYMCSPMLQMMKNGNLLLTFYSYVASVVWTLPVNIITQHKR